MTPEEKIQHRKEYNTKWREANKERIKKEAAERSRLWYNENKDKAKETQRKYYQDNIDSFKNKSKNYRVNNSDKIKEYQKNYRKNNNEKRNEYNKNRRLNDPLYKLTTNIRSSINQAFRRNSYTKKSKTAEILGCTFDEFKQHLESRFESWMTWDNHGLYNGELNYGWDIDHMIPLSSVKTEKELIKLCHFTNIKPLCSRINRDIKKNTFIS